ncbi:hypothetical protein DOMOVOI_02540 [Brevundimonas phage vB_BpoS-Domovoi]|uniref:Uncharacterized protein n=1 Tax=Brevundimonas phage vB_BpoS-Domovoi TaxID=2948598 RepID=A0A9E7MQY2_9CAUD|nr:hypothetical protein DOMOVOI_02540 [Brevundimonas phage vB_BpoS-Domovoi]
MSLLTLGDTDDGGWAFKVHRALVTALNGGTYPAAGGPVDQKADELIALAIERGVDFTGDVDHAVAVIVAQGLP